MDTDTTTIVWDEKDVSAWLRDPLTETSRHRDAMTAQWPADMRIGYFHAQTHMVPADQPTPDGYATIVPLCGITFVIGMTVADRVEAKPCTLCTDAYNRGERTGVKPEPFPVGTEVEFDILLGSSTRTIRGTVVPRDRGPQYRNYRVVQINEAMRCEVLVERLRAVK